MLAAMDNDRERPAPQNVDVDEELDELDEELAESFPASDPPASTQPKP
jgi:hypothetical protein